MYKILIFLLFISADALGQNIDGLWQGVLYQGAGGYFRFSMSLSQTGNSISGNSRIEAVGSPYWGAMSLTGTFNSSNNIFTFQEISPVDSEFVSGFYWCIKNGNLTYNSSIEKLEGPWSGGFCAPGVIELWRLKIISETNFCAGEPVNLEVTGQNIKWYSDYLLTNLVGIGNSFSPNISSSVTYYVTQTHFDTESPPFAIPVTVFPLSTSTLDITICEGEAFEGYTLAGVHLDTFKNSYGCDSIRLINLNVLPSLSSTQNISICQGETYQGFTTSGIYTDTLQAANGCDSLKILNLTILPNPSSTQNISICQGETYQGFSTAGVYTDTLQAANGCDSLKILNLTILPNPLSTQTASICQGEIYEGYSSSGTYVDVFTAANGCDSTRTLVLTVLSNVTSVKTASICQGEVYEGYSSSGTYVDVFTTANGCDSTRTLVLTVLPNIASSKIASICQGEVYEGYSSSGTYVDVFTAANGCDSIRTLTLTVLPNSNFIQHITICSGSNYDFNGQIIFTEGTYRDTITNISGCDSIITLDLKIARSDFLGNDTTICMANEYQLTSPSDSTRWFDDEIVKSKKINTTGIYWATILDANGCEIIDTIFVQFNVKTYIPNVFSPDDDGINDCFQPFFSELGFSSYRFSVFDRWGSHIYSTNNPDDCWDGAYRGKSCNPGVYVYFIEIKSNFCERTVMKGAVTLLK